MRILAAAATCVAAFAFVTFGRYQTMHLTEAEAFVTGLPYWLGALLCAGATWAALHE